MIQPPDCGPSAEPPSIAEHHVKLPEGLAELLRARALHEEGIDGQGVRVAVIDSGFYPHPFYVSRGYRIEFIRTRREPRPETDEYGHGTAQLASLFCVAPAATALAIKCRSPDPSDALRKAISLKPEVISCAWGFNIDKPGKRYVPRDLRPIQRLILQAVDQGICVTAAAGNGQYSFPGCMPEVLCAGGVYYSPRGGFEPSDASSHYESSLFPGRRVPDVCGPVGNRPHGRLLVVPVPPEARLARRPGFARLLTPGWAMFSGTSATTAMAAGAAALLIQSCPGITPEELKRALVESGRTEPHTGQRILTLDAAVEWLGVT